MSLHISLSSQLMAAPQQTPTLQWMTYTVQEVLHAIQSVNRNFSADYLWGILLPFGVLLGPIKLFKDQLITIISYKHYKIHWNGLTSKSSAVTVKDLSNNGTWINKQKIGKDQYMLTEEGNDIVFGQDPTMHELSSVSYCGYGVVVKAFSWVTNKWYAIKTIHAPKGVAAAEPHLRVSSQRDKMEDLAREVCILEQLQHNNVCKLEETFYYDSKISLVLEFVDGGDLNNYIYTHSTLVHLRIVHQDLKLENILLTSKKPPVVKVANFGLAKVKDSMSALKTICGTPEYMAPEVVLRLIRGYNNLVDSWSVGVIIFKMLTGKSPFIEDSTIAEMETCVTMHKSNWKPLEDMNISKNVKGRIWSSVISQLSVCHYVLNGTSVMLGMLQSISKKNDSIVYCVQTAKPLLATQGVLNHVVQGYS
ncbi:kinase-like protein [Coniophora puteana RWD-64-598 SS2]|uniref:Kinase-like protein n=1 Tax=Coniophora puteana (strain RWD-64-598) TaxID=741705 RepID=A0A5M3N1P5_CONPW|nr:kinase-like protein [Coniophora puteana RWD-64-598 SS2]EIW85309.1 kinase-like protein [Coniophora puteana RWD-64-598 SS2]